MNLISRLNLKLHIVKDREVLALDTSFAADSLEGMRLVKASRGCGWLFHEGRLTEWETKGVVQDGGRLVVWGEGASPQGASPSAWPTGTEGREFLLAFTRAWTALAERETLPAFSPAAALPYLTSTGWAFVFPPAELRTVLDSLQPLDERLAWEHLRHPDLTGEPSWSFATAALAWSLVTDLPWTQDDEAHLRQELRDLKRTLSPHELPAGPEPETLKLWLDALTDRAGTRPGGRWKRWAETSPQWSGSDSGSAERRQAAAARRVRRRQGAAFWRRRGTVLLSVGAGVGLLAVIVGTVLWGALRPDVTDTWSAEQVVLGYYDAVSRLDADRMRHLTQFDKGREPDLGRDEEEVSNLYVIRQVRTAYEHGSPIVAATDWEAQGQPALTLGQVLYGTTGVETRQNGTKWTVRYRKWVSDVPEGQLPKPVGFLLTDQLELVKTDRGWKIFTLRRERQPLP